MRTMGVKAFNVTSLSKVRLMDPKNVGYQDSIDIIRDELHRTRRSFVKIGWYLKHIKDQEMFKTDGYADIFELALDKFNISQPTATRFMNICKEFSVNHDSPELDEKFVDFSVSQLFEMLPMEEDKRERITPDMTVKQIREVKEDTRKKKEPDDGEIRDFCRVHRDDDSEIPGQTSIEKDFPEYLPAKQKAELQAEREEILTAPQAVMTGAEESENMEPEILEGDYRELQEDIEGVDELEASKEEPKTEQIDEASPHSEEQQVMQTQPDLPNLKNADQRKAWLADYKSWGLWYYDEHIDVNYYKFDFSDGSRLIVAEYPQRQEYWSSKVSDEYHYHLLEKGKKKYDSKQTYDEKFRANYNNETYLIEFLKDLKMGKRGVTK